jgi:hypothetical protein
MAIAVRKGSRSLLLDRVADLVEQKDWGTAFVLMEQFCSRCSEIRSRRCDYCPLFPARKRIRVNSI